MLAGGLTMIASTGACCFSCRHFRNSPEYLEQVFRGLQTMSSAHASVRKDDGICDLHDVYLSADACCGQYHRQGEGPDRSIAPVR
jgi:hypothetical protein